MGIFSFLKKEKTSKRLAIIDVTDANFNQQVIQRSYKSPVLVDYWAAWCGPCRQLGPVLESLAEDPESDFILAKLNTEHNPRTAARYNVRSIPNVKAFRNGQIVNEFTGALPQVLVKQFINKVSTTPPPTPRLKISKNPAKRLQQGEQYLRRGRGFEAFVAFNDFPESQQKERVDQLMPLAQFLFDMDDGDGFTGLDELDEQYLSAAKAMKKRKPQAALNHLISALDLGEEIDVPHTKMVIESLIALENQNSEFGHDYRVMSATD
jgi:putative thioredoxin